MSKIVEHHYKILIAILIAGSLTLGLPLFWNYIYAIPVDLPISLSPPGSVTTQFNVPQGNEYVLQFTFEREGYSHKSLEELIGRNFHMNREDFTDEKLQKAVGDKHHKTYYAGKYIGVKTGTPITIRWEIRALHNNALIQQEIKTIGMDSWGAQYVTRYISEFPSPVPNYTMPKFHLSSGKHELKATIVNDVPTLSGFNTHIRLIPNPSKDDFVLRQLFWYALIALDALLAMVFLFNVWRNRTKAE